MPYYVYILSNASGTTLYTGVTGDLVRRVSQHREGTPGSFTGRYRVSRLVYYEVADEISAAIEREKQIKAGTRQRKLNLIKGMNPAWRDLWEDILA
jgi:putative endonuclease